LNLKPDKEFETDSPGIVWGPMKITWGWYRILAIVLMSVVLSTWLIGPQVIHAAWGITDDHDTMTFIGVGNHHLPLGQYFHVMFTKTEMASLGHYLRFRPFYYPALLGEAVVWGDNVHLWYACRVGLLAVFIAGIWTVVARYLGVIVGLGVVLIVMRGPYWGDVWARLGPGEIYGAAGLGLWLVGLDGMFTAAENRFRNLSMLAVTVGTVMMVGSKETLFPFAGYSICAFALAVYLRRHSWAAKIHIGLMLAYSAATAAVIGLALTRAGQDFLGRPVGLMERLVQIVTPLTASVVKFVVPALLLLALTATFARWRAPKAADFGDSWLKPALIYSAGVILLWSLYLSQYIGYNGQWPTGYRYDFPGLLAVPALVVISAIFVAVVSQPYPLLNRTIRAAAVVAALAITVISVRAIPLPLSNAVAENIARTAKFQEALGELAELAKKDPQQPIILRANGAWSYEKIVSVAVYLHNYYDVANPIAVKFYSDGNPDPKYVGLEGSIKQWQRDGRQGQLVPFASVAERAGSGCLSIGLNGSAEPGCGGGFEM
jgi:hypothetical protein